MRRLLFAFALLFAAPLLLAAGWKKPYFGATKSGSWAKYTEDAGTMKMTTVNTRFADTDTGAPRVGSRTEFADNQYPAVINEYTLSNKFVLDRDLIDFMSAITAGGASSSDGAVIPFDEATLSAIRKNSQTYGPAVVFKATETIGGKSCDQYGYTLHHPGDPATTESGDLWMSEAVPFGLVKRTSTTKDAKGKVVSSYTRLLIDSGSGASPVAAKTKAPRTVYTLAEAYEAGLIRLTIKVDPAGKDGERAWLVVSTKDGHTITVNIPKGKTALRASTPLETFTFELAAAKSLKVSSEPAAPVDIRQLGEQRVTKGTFELSVYEGTPLFSGSVTVGFVGR